MKNNYNNDSLAALSQDLKRIALGLNRGSQKMVSRFEKEAIERKEELDLNSLKPYIKNLIKEINSAFKESDINKKAEDLLMYSTLIQNYVQRGSEAR